MDAAPAVVGDSEQTNIVGDVLPSQSIPTKSMLDGMGESMVVTIHNPLPNDFRVQYARTLAQPFTPNDNQRRVEEKVGSPIRRDELSPTVGHAVQYQIIKAGETINLPGDIAQLAVRKLVTYMLLKRDQGKKHNMVADPSARAKVEKQIVVKITDTMSLMNQASLTPEAYTEKQITELNQPPAKAEVPNPPPGQGAHYESKPKG